MQKEAKINFDEHFMARRTKVMLVTQLCLKNPSPTSIHFQIFTGKAMQKTEIPVMPMESASGRFESNHPDITASFELGWIRFL